MKTQPLVTIGIPTYNRPEGLGLTLSRVCNQTYRHLDILISDNASTDHAAVLKAIEPYSKDPRVRYVRQETNIGSLGNFPYLVNHALGELFLFAADDDEIELHYVESLLHKYNEDPSVAVVMGGYDVEDLMAKPIIKLNITAHLNDLKSDSKFARLKAYIQQPDHLGKSRLNWGLFKTPLLRKAFADCRSTMPKTDKPMWADFPIDFRTLSYGNLSIVEDVIWHVKLLPTSDGKSTLGGTFGKMLEYSKRTALSLSAAVQDSDLKETEKAELFKLIKKKARSEKVQLFVYYQIIGQWPWLARQIKKLWYVLFS